MVTPGTISKSTSTEMTEPDVDILQSIHSFGSFSENDLRQLLGLLTERTFQAGEEIVSAAAPRVGCRPAILF